MTVNSELNSPELVERNALKFPVVTAHEGSCSSGHHNCHPDGRKELETRKRAEPTSGKLNCFRNTQKCVLCDHH